MRAAIQAAQSFDVTFERLVGKVGAGTPAERMSALHEAFEQRTGSFGPDDPWFESRSRAFWDDVMTRQRGLEAAGDLGDEERPWADALSRSHRGLFQAESREGALILTDVLGGAVFLVHHVDVASRDAIASTSGLFDGTVVAATSPVRIALLPGAVFHPEEASDAIAAVVGKARDRGIDDAALLDALLRMELSLRTFSRVKPAYAYRAEALVG
jgi:hypothetical protein